MTPRLAITPENVRSGADAVGVIGSDIAAMSAPEPTNAAEKLKGLATAAALPRAEAAVRQSLTVISGRYDQFQQALRSAVDSYQAVDQVNRRTSVKDLSLSGFAGSNLAALGDVNSAHQS